MNLCNKTAFVKWKEMQNSNKYEIIIVGAGAAGITAAKAAFEKGCRSILVIDSRKEIGGVLRQCTQRGFGPGLTGPEYIEKLTEDFPTEVSVLLNAAVISITEDKTMTVSGRVCGVRKFCFEQLILASGCLEIPMGFLPIAGTRPDGIYTAGQVQEMINIQKKHLEDPVVILGSGDLGLIMAEQLSESGIRVKAVIEQKDSCGGMTRNRKGIEKYRIPLYCSSTITEVFGTKRLQAVRIKNSFTGVEQDISCKSLLVAAGLRPDRTLLRNLKKIKQNTEEYPDWVCLCGNCNKVHSMVDGVIKEGRTAGSAAAEKVVIEYERSVGTRY